MMETRTYRISRVVHDILSHVATILRATGQGEQYFLFVRCMENAEEDESRLVCVLFTYIYGHAV